MMQLMMMMMMMMMMISDARCSQYEVTACCRFSVFVVFRLASIVSALLEALCC